MGLLLLRSPLLLLCLAGPAAAIGSQSAICNMTKMKPRVAKFLQDELESCEFEKIMESE